MPGSADQLASINVRLSCLLPKLAAASGIELAGHFEEITALLQQARNVVSTERLNTSKDSRAREILAEYRHHLILLRDAIARLEPLLTAHRAQLRRELDHIRHAGSWASSVREVR